MDLLRRAPAVVWLVIGTAIAGLMLVGATVFHLLDRPPPTTVLTSSPQAPIAPDPLATITSLDRVLLLYDDYLVGITEDLKTYAVRYPEGVHVREVRGAAASSTVLALAVPGALVLVEDLHLRSTVMPGGHVLGVSARGADGFTVYLDRTRGAGPLEVGAVDVGLHGEIVPAPAGATSFECVGNSDWCDALGGLRPIRVPKNTVQIRWHRFQP